MKLCVVDAMADYTNFKFESQWNSFHKDYDDSTNRISPIMLQ